MAKRTTIRSRLGLEVEMANAWSTGRKSPSDFGPPPSRRLMLKPPLAGAASGAGGAGPAVGAGAGGATAGGMPEDTAPDTATGVTQVCGG